MAKDQKIGLHQGKPSIAICRTDRDRLTKLAEAISDRSPIIAEELLVELDRADVVSDEAMPRGIVRMGSTVEYHSDDGQERRVSLVYPGEADISLGRVSILTPIGTALIGLSAGQSISWTARDEHRHRLTVISVGDPDLAAMGKAQ
ncbi:MULTISPECIES: nucleoside diphosphate kinase regulator [Rhizobium]|uniref:Regulator of nucleoside diphosphate kinase n=1 Tax=Rhizobium miluonense TaxID=411945 RepID=A0A1C3WI93_9HYPH|nr:nucleoside diphosphate kinase regulator [Rhizobium miluonense]SCB39669.1 regulator of nucleoside diphosphate kinase [Rhizobium miluonense]